MKPEEAARVLDETRAAQGQGEAPEESSAPEDLAEDGDGADDQEPGLSRPYRALFETPEEAPDAAAAAGRAAFVLRAGLVDAWFLHRSDTLWVTFDNLNSIGEYDPPQPWLQGRAAKAGASILGIMASRKDWYRNAETAAVITALREAGFFARFRNILFVGASMGGYAALAYAGLVPGARVLAFSPQTTLARKIVPFDKRYRYAQRKWDWSEELPYRDAAAAITDQEVTLVYDPLEHEDRLHAARIAGPRVTRLIAPLFGHRAIRMVKELGLLQDLIEAAAAGRVDARAWARAMRGRRELHGWRRGLIKTADARGHDALAARVAELSLEIDPEMKAARRLLRKQRKARRAEKEARGRMSAARATGDERILVPGGAAGVFTGEILSLGAALVVPEREHDTPLASGVIDAQGAWVELSKAWIRARKTTPAPTIHPEDEIEELAGRHLFCGHFRGHFGHFLVESSARLWALDHIEGGVDGLIYLPYRGAIEPVRRAIEGQAGFFKTLGIDLPVRSFAHIQRVERLFVPELGFGWNERYAGSPAYRAFMQGRLGAAAPAAGGEKLYVSRARLPAQRGGVLGETVIEENLARAGYEIFYPEKAPLSEQIAHYKAARQIVALDGSALHLAAYVMPAGGRVGMILRRSKANAADYDLQFRNFCGITPDVIDVIKADWVAGDAARVDFRSIGELDFGALFAQLIARGYLPADFRPELPTEAEIRALLESYEERRGEPFRALGAQERHPEDEEEE